MVLIERNILERWRSGRYERDKKKNLKGGDKNTKKGLVDTLSMDAKRDVNVKSSKEIAEKLDEFCQDMNEDRSALVRRLIHKELARHSYLNDDGEQKVIKDEEDEMDVQEYVQENREMLERVAKHGERV